MRNSAPARSRSCSRVTASYRSSSSSVSRTRPYSRAEEPRWLMRAWTDSLPMSRLALACSRTRSTSSWEGP